MNNIRTNTKVGENYQVFSRQIWKSSNAWLLLVLILCSYAKLESN
jgi:hypothetical protein